MSLNPKQLQALGQLMVVKRDIELVIGGIVSGATPQGLQPTLGKIAGDLAELRNQLRDPWDA